MTKEMTYLQQLPPAMQKFHAPCLTTRQEQIDGAGSMVEFQDEHGYDAALNDFGLYNFFVYSPCGHEGWYATLEGAQEALASAREDYLAELAEVA